MARRRSAGSGSTGAGAGAGAGSAKGAVKTGGGYKPRLDWSKIALYTFSIIIVLSMMLSMFASLLSR